MHDQSKWLSEFDDDYITGQRVRRVPDLTFLQLKPGLDLGRAASPYAGDFQTSFALKAGIIRITQPEIEAGPLERSLNDCHAGQCRDQQDGQAVGTILRRNLSISMSSSLGISNRFPEQRIGPDKVTLDSQSYATLMTLLIEADRCCFHEEGAEDRSQARCGLEKPGQEKGRKLMGVHRVVHGR